MTNTHDATFYVQIEPEFRTPYGGVDPQVRSIKAVRITQQKPESPKPGTVTTKLTVRVPDAAFLPLRPEAVIVVPDDMVAANDPIEVEAGDPS
ncbi:hypothetical protein [Janibacter terrae]|uniref:hypothetical protein n=1 Tax=Janibacter terrae TaxID=103817 RepID=UPI0031F79741